MVYLYDTTAVNNRNNMKWRLDTLKGDGALSARRATTTADISSQCICMCVERNHTYMLEPDVLCTQEAGTTDLSGDEPRMHIYIHI